MEPADADLDAALRGAAAARSSARGNWFDCTPTSATMPAPAASIMRGDACRDRMRVLVSSIGVDVDLDVVAEDLLLGAVQRRP